MFYWITELLNYWITEFIDKNICHYSKRARTCHPATSCVRDQDATTAPARHMWETGSSKWAQFMLQWSIRFSEFTKLSELLFHLGKTPLRPRYFVCGKLDFKNKRRVCLVVSSEQKFIHYHGGSSSKFRRVWLFWPHCIQLISLKVKRVDKHNINQPVFFTHWKETIHVGDTTCTDRTIKLSIYILLFLFKKPGKWFVSSVMKKWDSM